MSRVWLLSCLSLLAVWTASAATATGAAHTTRHLKYFNRALGLIHEYRKADLTHRPDVTRKQPSHPDTLHRITFALKQPRIHDLEDRLHQIADHTHPDYGKHLSLDDLAAYVANPTAVSAVEAFAAEHGLIVRKRSRHSEYITVEGPVHKLSHVLKANFFEFDIADERDGRRVSVHRALEYTMPETLTAHVDSILKLIDLPHVANTAASKPVKLSADDIPRAVHTDQGNNAIYSGYVSPGLLNTYYSIASNTGSASLVQGCFQSLNQTLSTGDLSGFQSFFGLPTQSVTYDVNGHMFPNACASDVNNCAEVNLDVQYMMGMSQVTPQGLYYYQDDNGSVDFSTVLSDLLASTAAPIPSVYSISYGMPDLGASYNEAYYFNVEAIKVSAVGTTITVSSGDNGAPGSVAASSSSCGYYPEFPTSSPYVVSVGATQGPEASQTEVVCSSSTGSAITSGGGFSNWYTTPAFQSQVVAAYFTRAGSSLVNLPASASSMRGFPDVSLLGNNYLVLLNGLFYGVSGTSASSPVFAAMVSLVNSARYSHGLPSLGWLNPVLYSHASSYIRDITTGNNKCYSGSTCCSEGYTALTGWDPTTGLGSVKFNLFLSTLATLSVPSSATPIGVVTPAAEPTIVPSYTPTNHPSTAAAATARPTVAPTLRPTVLPTVTPSTKPTAAPTVKSTSRSSSGPTLQPTKEPSTKPSTNPSTVPSLAPSKEPTWRPSANPSTTPSLAPTKEPSTKPSAKPSATPSKAPTKEPSFRPTVRPSTAPSARPSAEPSLRPTGKPSNAPSPAPTKEPSCRPTLKPTAEPSTKPTVRPSTKPTTFSPSFKATLASAR